MAADLFKIKRYQWCCLSVWFVVQRNISFWKEILSWLNIQCPTSRMYFKFVRYKDNDDYKTSSRIYIANFVEQPTSGRYFKFVRGTSNADYKISKRCYLHSLSLESKRSSKDHIILFLIIFMKLKWTEATNEISKDSASFS